MTLHFRRPSPLDAWMLLLLSALVAAKTFDVDGGPARLEWCSRVCPNPNPAPAPSPPPPPTPPVPNLTCPQPLCPQPVCPPPQCPQPACPPLPAPSLSCPACPQATPFAPAGANKNLPWKSLKSYNATYLGFYKFYSDKLLDWYDAQMVCEEDGAHLVIINSVEEDEFLRSNMKPSPGWIHVGVHDLIQEGQRLTVLGEPVDTTGFYRWLYGHQKADIKLNCAWIKRTDSGMGMGPCKDKGPFVCELPVI